MPLARSPQRAAVAALPAVNRGRCCLLLHAGTLARLEQQEPLNDVACWRWLQVSLGFLLPTLVVWQAQLEAAQQYASGQRGQRPLRGSSPPLHHMRAAQAELACSGYSRVCLPVVQSAAAYGWSIILGLAALLTFVAAVVWQSKWGSAGGQHCAAD